MANGSILTLAVVAEDSLQLHRLRSAIEDFGCKVLCFSPGSLEDKELNSEVSAWLVDLREDDDLLDRFFDIDAPVLLGFEAAPSQRTEQYPKWEKRLYSKIKQLLGTDLIQDQQTQASLSAIENIQNPAGDLEEFILPQNLLSDESEVAKHTWVLGSSLGGPEAVKEFLDALPKGLPVAFIYGQHIDAQFVSVLAQVLGRHAHFKLNVAQEGMALYNGQVLIVPADKEVQFVSGRVKIMNREWPGPYGPSVDQLILNVQQCFKHTGVIIFSGMGNDGAEAVQALKEKDVQIWAQSSETCGSSAMPDACRETQAVSFSGSPRELAKHLVEHIQTLEMNQQNFSTNGDSICSS